MFFGTCLGVELALTQDEGEHEDELGGALGKGLNEPQHAEVVGQVDGETPAAVVTVTEGAPSPRRTQGNSRETLHSLIWNKLRYC